ncbi:MAG: hypothetical protein D6826_03530, partial [Alphaproteobacteria bacterium]
MAIGLLAVAAMAASWALSDSARAQSAEIRGLVDRVDRLQRELTTLQRQVYRGEPPPPAATAAPPSE